MLKAVQKMDATTNLKELDIWVSIKLIDPQNYPLGEQLNKYTVLIQQNYSFLKMFILIFEQLPKHLHEVKYDIMIYKSCRIEINTI